jgi:deazaflavin-dependent oxidoreductase (nitroreductase family)
MSSVVATDRVVIASRAPDLRMMRFFNPVVRTVLRSPFHGLLSGHILLLTYTGRRSGRQYTLPVGYLRDGDALLIVSQHSELKRWWRNLRGDVPVAVLLRGQRVNARADVIEDPAAVAVEVERLIERLGAREASRQLYMSLDVAPPPTREQLAQALPGVVVVRITPERARMYFGAQPKKETEYVKQPVH